MIHVLCDDDMTYAMPVRVVSGPDLDLEDVKKQWIIQEIGQKPVLERKIPWQAEWNLDNSLAPPEYHQLWLRTKEYDEARRLKCTLDKFVQYLATQGFNLLSFKALSVYPLEVICDAG
jgi:hypothetical protein